MTLRLGLVTGGADPATLELVREAERLGFDSTWCGESYGVDAVSRLAWLGGQTTRIRLGSSILQIPARAPALTAMTAMTLDQLTGGRFILGLGVSGPQVVEGWYAQDYAKPLARTREYIDIVRAIVARDKPVEYVGEHYQMPFVGGTGLGKPLKSIVRPLRTDIPIYLGAEGPKNVALAFEIADGWVPLYWSPYRTDAYTMPAVVPDGFEIAVNVSVVLDDDVSNALWPIKATLGFYIGGMGAKSRNFHTELMARMGFEDEAYKIQDLFFEGKRDEAIMAVPDAFADEISLVGPKERIAERLDAWRATPVTTLLVGNRDPETLELLADLTQ